MLKILQKRLSVALDEEEASFVQQSLQARYNSLLYRVRLEYLDRLGLDMDSYSLTIPPGKSPLAVGEIFMPEPGSILYLKGLRGKDYLEAGVITRDEGRDFLEFFDEVRESVLEVRGGVGEWEIVGADEDVGVEDSRPGEVEVPERQLQASRELMDPSSRVLLSRIQEAGSIFFNKIETDDKLDTEERIRRFEDLDLVNKDFAVLCRRTGQQILRVADRATIEESSQKAFKCFICGNAISQEVVEEILTCTETCNDLLDAQKWLLVLVEGILGELGLHSENLQVYQAPGAPVQLFLNFNHQRYLLVLSTTRLTLDQAYLVGAHLSAYQVPDCVVISSERITTLMKHHLTQANPDTTFSFIDTLDRLEEKLRYVLMEKQRAFLQKLLGGLSAMTPVRVPDLVLRKMAPDASAGGEDEVPVEKVRARTAPPEPEPEEVAEEPEFLPEAEYESAEAEEPFYAEEDTQENLVES